LHDSIKFSISVKYVDIENTKTNMRRLTTRKRSEKCVVRRFRRCANVYSHKPR